MKWLSDSQNCVHIIKVGRKISELHNEALAIFKICLIYRIDLEIQWVPREHNYIADNTSKIRDTDNWEVSDEFFHFMDTLWGPHEIDRFATASNRRVTRYNSKFYDFETEGVDCFTQDWGSAYNWLVPPIWLVNKTVLHLLACGGHGTLIVPKWSSSPFWPLLFDKQFTKKSYIIDVLEFGAGQNIFLTKKVDVSSFNSRRFSSKVLAIKL